MSTRKLTASADVHVPLRNRVNSAAIRRLNTARVFHALRENAGSSQQRLIRLTGLDAATVSSIVVRLEAEGIVRRAASPRSGHAGRPETALVIAPDCGLLIGAGIDLDCISLVATGLDGHPRASLLLPGTTDAERAIATLQRGVAELRADYGGQQGRVLGIGIGVPGLMDAAGRLVLAPHLGWRDLPIVTRLRAAFQVPVYVDNDNKAAVLAEHIFGVARGIADFVFMYGHTGIGGGLYLGGRLYRGCNGMAGELGHMKIVPGGRGCVCGGRGCVEAYVSARAIGERLRETGRDLTEKALTEAAAAGDPVVRTVLDEAGSYLGLTIANLVNIMNPRAVVVGGNLAALAAFMLPAARAVLVANSIDKMLDETQILTSTLGAESIAMGGVALALEGFLPLPQGLRGIAAS